MSSKAYWAAAAFCGICSAYSSIIGGTHGQHPALSAALAALALVFVLLALKIWR